MKIGPVTRSAQSIAADPALLSTFASKIDPMGFGFAFNYHPGIATGTAGAFGASNRAFYSRVVNGIAAATKVRIGVATSSGNIDVGKFPASGSGVAATPGAKTVSSGSVACPAQGVADITIASTQILPGEFLGISSDNNTLRLQSIAAVAAAVAVMAGAGYYQETAFPLPANPSPSGAGTVGPMLLMGVA